MAPSRPDASATRAHCGAPRAEPRTIVAGIRVGRRQWKLRPRARASSMPPGVVPAIGSVDKEGAPTVPAVAIVVDPWRIGVVGRGVRVGWHIRIVGRRIRLNRRRRLGLVVVVALND